MVTDKNRAVAERTREISNAELFLAEQADHCLRDQSLSRERRMYVAGAVGKFDQQAGCATVTVGRDVRRQKGRKGVGHLHIESTGHFSENAIQRYKA